MVRAWGCVGQMGLGGLGLAYPRRQSRWAAPRTPTPVPPIMHHWAGAGARWWGWGGLAASGLTKAPLYCSPHPDWCGWPSLTANHSQPWPALPWAAFLPRSSLPPSHLWGEVSQAMFLESLRLGNPLVLHLRMSEYDQGSAARLVQTGHRFKCTDKIKYNGPGGDSGKLVVSSLGSLRLL